MRIAMFNLKLHFLFLLILLYSCKSVKQYAENDSPVWIDNTISENYSHAQDVITLVVFNLKEGEKTDLAIQELTTVNLKDIHILLLQEMDEKGVIQFSKALGLNYLYYPIGTDKRNGNNFGNAILSKYRITNEEKLILPHSKIDNRIRNAPNCIIDVQGKKILVYSIHNETILLPSKKRQDQLDSILNDIDQSLDKADFTIVGGDFNTLKSIDVKKLVLEFESRDFKWANENLGYTSKALFNIVKPKNDHVFIKDLKLIEGSKMEKSKSSDHLPLVMKLAFN